MNEFIARLKQRKLVQWALAYIAFAFALIQVLDVVADSYDWPHSAMHVVFGLIALGFVIALVLAWYHGERGAQRVSGAELLLIALVLAIGGGLLWQFARVPQPHKQTSSPDAAQRTAFAGLQTRTAKPARRVSDMDVANNPGSVAAPITAKSIAVLPFENLSEDKGNAYFAEGMQDLILTKLADIGDLKVISRTSTARYQSHPDNLKTIAQQLGVATILEGSVQKAGNQVLINVQLIDARGDNHLWAESYTRTLDNIFGVEGEVAQKVADALKAKLSPTDTARVTAVPTQNPEAYDLYLRALAFEHRANDQYALTASEMPQAIELLQQALAKDPNFALADASLGWAHMYMYFFGSDRTDAQLKAAKEAIDRALALQPDLGEAHLAQALYWYWGFRDYARAQAELALARKVLPHDSDVEVDGAAVARRQGRWQQALEGFRQAQVYDPRDASPVLGTGQTYAMLRNYAEADRAYAHAAELSLDPTLALGRQVWNTVVWKGDLAPLRAWVAALPQDSEDSAYSSNLRFELAWLSRDFAAAAKAVLETRSPGWTSQYGNTVLPVRLFLAWALEASGDKAKSAALYRDLHAAALASVRERPDDWDRHLALGFAAAGLGMKDEALREGRRAAELLPVSRDAFAGPEVLSYVARIDVRVGDRDAAIAILQKLLATPAGLWVSPAMLRLDPVWDPLRGDPRFQALLKKHGE